MLKSGSSLSCKIYQRFCLKGTDLQECAWSACLIKERGSIFFLHLLLVIYAGFEKRWFGFGCFIPSSAVVRICCCSGLGCLGAVVRLPDSDVRCGTDLVVRAS